jgi:hypothetical protein
MGPKEAAFARQLNKFMERPEVKDLVNDFDRDLKHHYRRLNWHILKEVVTQHVAANDFESAAQMIADIPRQADEHLRTLIADVFKKSANVGSILDTNRAESVVREGLEELANCRNKLNNLQTCLPAFQEIFGLWRAQGWTTLCVIDCDFSKLAHALNAIEIAFNNKRRWLEKYKLPPPGEFWRA